MSANHPYSVTLECHEFTAVMEEGVQLDDLPFEFEKWFSLHGQLAWCENSPIGVSSIAWGGVFFTNTTCGQDAKALDKEAIGSFYADISPEFVISIPSNRIELFEQRARECMTSKRKLKVKIFFRIGLSKTDETPLGAIVGYSIVESGEFSTNNSEASQ